MSTVVNISVLRVNSGISLSPPHCTSTSWHNTHIQNLPNTECHTEQSRYIDSTSTQCWADITEMKSCAAAQHLIGPEVGLLNLTLFLFFIYLSCYRNFPFKISNWIIVTTYHLIIYHELFQQFQCYCISYKTFWNRIYSPSRTRVNEYYLVWWCWPSY